MRRRWPSIIYSKGPVLERFVISIFTFQSSPDITTLSLDLSGKQWRASDNEKKCSGKKVERTFDVSKGEMNASTATLNGSNSKKFSSKLSAADNNVSQAQQKLQQLQHQVGVSTDSIKSNFKDLDKSRLRQKRLSSLGTQLNGQFPSQHVHHTSVSFSKSGYAAFKKGNIVRGILCPSLTNSFRYVTTLELFTE